MHMVTKIDHTNVEVSTIKLHSHFSGSERYETCIFNRKPVRANHKSCVIRQYTSHDDAIKGHYTVVATLTGAYSIRNNASPLS
jgi:hypothetical protein